MVQALDEVQQKLVVNLVETQLAKDPKSALEFLKERQTSISAINQASSLAERDQDQNLSKFIGRMKFKDAFNFMLALLPKKPHEANRLQTNDKGLTDD